MSHLKNGMHDLLAPPHHQMVSTKISLLIKIRMIVFLTSSNYPRMAVVIWSLLIDCHVAKIYWEPATF